MQVYFSMCRAEGLNLALVSRKWAGRVVDTLFPPRCAACGRDGPFLCSVCLVQSRPLLPPYCAICATPLTGGEVCQRCASSPLGIDGIRSPYLMEGPVREALHRFKYNQWRVLGPVLGGLLARYAMESHLSGEVVVPVPLHPGRERSRGYNQATLLGKELARITGMDFETGALARVKNTPPLASGTSVEERRRVVEGAFVCRGPGLAGKGVVLVDDVCTTGATLEACAQALRRVGVSSVWGLTVARKG